ncbi:MAG TPA: YeaH/YhbH family protein, partial [Stellaceae bacterium]|nr:YeaH/YhbH family protein [Stellaceae bacterium]
IIDRRPNPKGKSLTNRQRFIDRARGEVREALADALKRRKLGEAGGGEKIAIPTRGITEPVFRSSSRGGKREYVAPGNKKFVAGDRIERPQGGQGGGRSSASNEDNGEQDAFEFVLSREEFLDLFFEDLELPDLIKTRLRESEATQLTRAGFSVSGSPSNLNLVRTMRNSLARRISLHRPRADEIEAIERQVQAATAADDAEGAAQGLHDLETAQRRSRRVAYIDPVDVRYNRYERVPKPNTQAVMFCLMDVSGSMTEAMKDLAKRFFLLLHVFLERRYKQVNVVFIRHTSNAQEVDEDTFFHSRETGGTIVSTALEEMLRVVRERYSPDNWNIYAAQASDGDNYTEDSDRCSTLLGQEILPITQYFAYIEVGAEATLRHGFPSPATDLWRTYAQVGEQHQNFAMRRVADPTQIFPVFHELFAKHRAEA